MLHFITSFQKTMELPVFSAFTVVHYAQITLVAGLTDLMIFDSIKYRTTGFVNMCTVIKMTFFRNLKYFLEKMTHFKFLHIYCSKTFNARCVNHIASSWERKHFRESCCMHSLIVILGNDVGSCFGMRSQHIDEGRFSDSRIARNEFDFLV